MKEPIITVKDLSKLYRLGGTSGPYLSLRDSITEMFRFGKQSKKKGEEFWALKDINLTINRGERVGIIGRNGAGKSTFLKILSQINPPTTGSVTLNGRVASLLEVGTGFHPELTGRENIFLNGAILGMTQSEIRRKFDEIVAFAEIEQFLDTPVKRYSSGMYVRLAFAVAAHLEPEILLVDEVLAVGDVEFQKKCLGKMEEVGKSGRTIIFVSHNMGAIEQLCDQVIFLEKGRVKKMGNTSEVIATYLNQYAHTGAVLSFDKDKNRSANITQVRILNQEGKPSSQIPICEPFSIEATYTVEEPLQNALLIFAFFAGGDYLLLSAESDKTGELKNYEKGTYVTRIAIPAFLFNVGPHYFEVALHQPFIQDFDRKQDIQFEIMDVGDPRSVIFKGHKFGKVATHLEYKTEHIR